MRNLIRGGMTLPAGDANIRQARTMTLRATMLAFAAVAAGGLGLSGAVLNGMIMQAHAADAPAITEGGITLRSITVTMPDSETEFPGGDAAQVMVQNCTACHSPGMIMTQPSFNEATWRDEVTKMINVYKAPVSAEDVPAIVAYLVARKGIK